MKRKVLFFLLVLLMTAGISLAAKKTFISLNYGYTPLHFTDFDQNSESYNALFNHWFDVFSPAGFTEKTGNFGRFSHANSFETEMRLEIANQFELALIFDVYSSKMRNEVTINSGEYSVYGFIDSKIAILNPNLVLDRYFVLTKGVYLEPYVGVGYFFAKMPYKQYFRFYTPESPGFEETSATLKTHGIGILGGLTLEVRPFKFLGLVVGARYREVQMKKISGSGSFIDSETGKKKIDDGTLYMYENTDHLADIGFLPMLVFSEERPDHLYNVREAELNLSGWTFLGGIRIWF